VEFEPPWEHKTKRKVGNYMYTPPGSQDLLELDSKAGGYIGCGLLLFNILVTGFLYFGGISHTTFLGTAFLVFIWSIVIFAGIATISSSGCSFTIFVPISVILIGVLAWFSYTTLTGQKFVGEEYKFSTTYPGEVSVYAIASDELIVKIHYKSGSTCSAYKLEDNSIYVILDGKYYFLGNHLGSIVSIYATITDSTKVECVLDN